jgi:hypothetical protein
MVALPYYLGNRPVERIIAFVLTMAAVFWYAVNYHSALSDETLAGFLYGVFACFLVTMMGLSMTLEGSLYMIVTILIGIKYGVKGAVAGFLGWALVRIVMVLLIMLANIIFWRKRPIAS